MVAPAVFCNTIDRDHLISETEELEQMHADLSGNTIDRDHLISETRVSVICLRLSDL